MGNFPEFIKNPTNRVSAASLFSKAIEGYLFDGADGSQVIFWTYSGPGQVPTHTHEYDEYLLVIEGQYTLILGEKRIPLNAGQEYLIKKGVPHGGEAVVGTRTIDVFGGKRAKRAGEN
jgi:quercetin dioxygenase-like cupin family protein